MKITSETKMLLGMAAIVLVGGAYLIFGSKIPLGGGGSENEPPKREQRTISKAEFDEQLKGAPVKGNPDARFTIIEFADFQCPTCRKAYGALIKDFGGKLDVRFAFRHFPIEEMHQWAIPAALAVEAVGAQGKFWEMYASMFEEEKPAWTPAYMRDRAQKLGVDLAKYDAFITDPENTKRIIAARDKADKKGIFSTPTFWIYDKQTGKVSTPVALEIYKVLKDLPGLPPPPVPSAPEGGTPPGDH
ncbi:MAG: thioredoxin domain-containing protein [Armatimonadota bacterium]